MNTQHEALRLADIVGGHCGDELRRLHVLNAELLEALKGMVQLDEEEHQRGPGDIDICKEVQDAHAAIAKAESEEKPRGLVNPGAPLRRLP